jgi:hypothetical protein
MLNCDLSLTTGIYPLAVVKDSKLSLNQKTSFSGKKFAVFTYYRFYKSNLYKNARYNTFIPLSLRKLKALFELFIIGRKILTRALDSKISKKRSDAINEESSLDLLWRRYPAYFLSMVYNKKPYNKFIERKSFRTDMNKVFDHKKFLNNESAHLLDFKYKVDAFIKG